MTDSETGLPMKGVVVSDGYTSSETDEKGIYQLKRNTNARHVFCSIPADCDVVVKNNLPDFFAKVLSYYTIYRKDFKLTKLKSGAENKFTLFCLADPQVKTSGNITRFETETIKDIKTEIANHGACYGITLGDIVFDTPELMTPMKNLLPTSGLKFFNVIGNHDHYQETTKDMDAIVNYEECFGPTNYSFNRGNAHIIAMDDIIYTAKQTYTIGFSDDQIKWLKSDLQYVPKDKLIIVCVHSPIRNQSDVTRGQDFYAAIESYHQIHIMSGHTHYNSNVISNSGIYEHVHGAVCGTWWASTICSDGTPNGYGVYEIDGNNIVNWYYKPTNYDKSFQIRMYPVNSFGENSEYVVANVWNSDSSWKVELFEDGVKTGDMVRFTGYEKCAYALSKSFGKAEPTSANEATDWYRRPDHLYRIVPHSQGSSVLIKATDPFGNVYTQSHFTSTIDEVKSYNY